jgi:hypothetical protein
VTRLVLDVSDRGNTVTVRVGRAVESITRDYKSRAELVEAVRWAAISKGVRLPDLEVAALVEKALDPRSST